MGKKSKQKFKKVTALPAQPSTILDHAIEYLFYSLFFFAPLILWPNTSEVFEFNKMLFVYVVTILILASWLGKSILQKKIEFRRTPLDLPLLLFLASQVLSTIFSIDLHTSLWGYYSRFHGGLISTISYIVLYYAFVSNIKLNSIKFIFYSILASATLVSLYGVLEHFGIDKNLWVQDVQNRVFSTLGQPNWLSAYLIAVVPLPIFLILNQKSFWPKAGYCLLTALFLLTIWFTKSQSGLGATAIILSLIAIIFILQNLPSRATKTVFVVGAIIGLLALAVSKWSFVQKLSPFGVPDLAKLVQTDNQNRFGGSDSMIIRQVVWSGAREIARRNPIFGTGVETFGYAYYAVRPPAHNLLSEWEFLYNKAHNEYLNMLANTGFFGLASYLLLIGWTLMFFINSIKTKAVQDMPTNRAQAGTPPPFAGREIRARFLAYPNRPLVMALTLGYLSILITNYFGFSVVPIALFFFLFPALTVTISNHSPKYLTINYPLNHELSFLALILATIYLLLIPIGQWRADLAYTKGKYLENTKYLKESLDRLQNAVGLNPSEPTFVAELGLAQAIAATAVKQQLDNLDASGAAAIRGEGEKMLADFINAAEANSQKAITLNRRQTNFYKNKAKTDLYLGTIKPEYNQNALDALLELAKLAPTDPKVFFNIGVLYDQLGQKEAAKKALQHALDLKPDYGQVSAYLSNISDPNSPAK